MIGTRVVNCVHIPILSARTPHPHDNYNEQANEHESSRSAHYDRQEGFDLLHHRCCRNIVSLLLRILQRVDGNAGAFAHSLVVLREQLHPVMDTRLQRVNLKARRSVYKTRKGRNRISELLDL